MKKLSSIAALGCFLLAPAFASASIDTSVSFSYGMADSVFDEDGEKSSIDEAFGLPDGSVSANFMVIGLGAGYQVRDFARLVLRAHLTHSDGPDKLDAQQAAVGLGRDEQRVLVE